MSAVIARATTDAEPEGQEPSVKYATMSQWQVERFIARQVCRTRAIEPVSEHKLLEAVLEFLAPDDLAAARSKQAAWQYAADHAGTEELRHFYTHVAQVVAGAEIEQLTAAWKAQLGELLDRLVDRGCLSRSRHTGRLHSYQAYEPGPDYVAWNYHRDDPEPAEQPEETQDGAAAA
jgi:hypothetical protein